MAIMSHIVEEGHGRGRGHVSHGKGKGKGHDKHAADAMADGVYTIEISGIDHDNPGAFQATPPTTLADGTQMNTEVTQGSITIEDAPGGQDAALHLVTDSNSGRLRVNDIYDADNQIRLGDLDTLNFDYFIESASQDNQIPVIRLFIDADGNLATTNDRGELVFEWAYQGFGDTTVGVWSEADLVGDDWVAWQRSFGMNRDQIVNMTEFSDWADEDGFTPVGGLTFTEDSLVLGWSIASGSGNGTNSFFLDDLTIGGVTYEFTA